MDNLMRTTDNPPIDGSQFLRLCTFVDLGGRKKFTQAIDKAWFLWSENKYQMEHNRSHWPYSWKTLLGWMRQGKIEENLVSIGR